MRTLLSFVLLLAFGDAMAAQSLALQSTQLTQLGELPVGASIVIDGFPDGFGSSASIRFERIDVYARGARIIASGPDGERELPRSQRIELVGADASGSVRAHLAFDPGFTQVRGAGSSSAGAFAISASKGAQLDVVPASEALPPGITPEVIPSDDGLPNGRPTTEIPQFAQAIAAASAVPRGAVVAVDVDHELLLNRFGGTGTANLSAATSWIADLFATMNVLYQRDLNVTLEQGTTIFRTGATPYVIAPNVAANSTDLNNFGNYWQANQAGVPRNFTALLSGQMTGGFSASGIAWINSYCNTAGNGGSYSVTKVFTNSGVGVDLSARVVGHELGHNFGAAHTHCTDVNTGVYSVATNTIDQCYKGEAGSGCYGGSVSCPSAGPGHPLGTLMSYCNTSAPNGANCGQNVLQFHPTQVATLSTLIAQNTPSCLSATADLIFKDGFDG